MAATPRNTLLVYPSLTEGQVDVLLQRFDGWWQRNSETLTVRQAGGLLFELFPEDFAGDEGAAMSEAERIRLEAGGARPMANGYRGPAVETWGG